MNATESHTSTANQRICQQLVEREVGHCVSSLVHHFATNENALEGSDYTVDDVIDLCGKDDWEEPIREAIGDASRETLIEYLEEYSNFTADNWEAVDRDTLEHEVFEAIEDWQQASEFFDVDEPNRLEAYEHWIVSNWFAEKLRERGEITGELFNLTIWGRCCTGQAIHLDGVIGEIASSMEILHGQKSDWSKQS